MVSICDTSLENVIFINRRSIAVFFYRVKRFFFLFPLFCSGYMRDASPRSECAKFLRGILFNPIALFAISNHLLDESLHQLSVLSFHTVNRAE